MECDLVSAVRRFGACDAGVTTVSDGPGGLPYAISVAVRLSDAIVEEIDTAPTYTYFNHYRSVNYLIDQILLKAGLWLQERNARYITVAASQSRPDAPFEGRYSHKKAACLAGLGAIGRNGLFLHRVWGPRVRLGTIFTDWDGCEALVRNSVKEGAVAACTADGRMPPLSPACESCELCVVSCPAGALGCKRGEPHGASDSREPRDSSEGIAFDPAVCSAWMKKTYQHIGRGAVCGVCMRVCPAGRPASRGLPPGGETWC